MLSKTLSKSFTNQKVLKIKSEEGIYEEISKYKLHLEMFDEICSIPRILALEKSIKDTRLSLDNLHLKQVNFMKLIMLKIKTES